MFKTILSDSLNTKCLIKLIQFNSIATNTQNIGITSNTLDQQFIRIQNPLLKPKSADYIPTITEVSATIRDHAAKVYRGPRYEQKILLLTLNVLQN